MPKPVSFQGQDIRNNKGIILFIVLGTIFIVIILANVILKIITSQSRLTHHQVSRIQAYYAAQAGMNYALDKLRVGTDANWPQPALGTFYIRHLCNGCTGAGDINETGLASSIQSVSIAVAYRGVTATVGSPAVAIPGCNPCNPPAGVNICICNTATYTYTP